MTYMGNNISEGVTPQDRGDNAAQAPHEALVLVIEDDVNLSGAFRAVCECLNVVVERMPTRDDLDLVLRHRRPMAVVAEMDAAGQDGCHVLMTVAAHDRDMPVLLITGDDHPTRCHRCGGGGMAAFVCRQVAAAARRWPTCRFPVPRRP